MDQEMREQFELIFKGMADMEKRITTKVTTQTKALIENDIGKRLDALFGEDLQNRLTALENRIAS